MATCDCGCGAATTLTDAGNACDCGCDCCAPPSGEEELVQLRRLRDRADERLRELEQPAS